MIHFFEALTSNPFLRYALLAGFAASFASGIMGSYVVIKRIVSMSGSIAHSVLGGMGICLWLQKTYHLPYPTPLHGALLAGIVAALLIGWVHLKYKEREDTLIAALWATGMSLGVIFITLAPGYSAELLDFLFGNILFATKKEILVLVSLDLFLGGILFFFFRKFLAVCFDEQQALLQGLKLHTLYLLLLCLIAVSIVLLIQVVGTILVVAMLALPAASSAIFTKKLSNMMSLSVGLAALFSLLGVYVSYTFNWPPGSGISLIAALSYTLCLVYKK